ncbi:MAG: ATP-binding protein [Thermofilaceae archaeon]
MAVEERIKGEDKHMIDEIVSRMHGYVIRDEHIPWRFVDREAEVWNMVDEEGVVEGGWITVLYGPKGCGKSTLFSALRYSLAELEREGFESGYELVYVSAKPRVSWDVSRAYSSKDLWGLLAEAVSSLGGSLDQSGVVKGLVDAAKLIAILVDRIARKFEKGKNILIVLDEARASGRESLGAFRDWLEVFANDIREDNRVYSRRRGSIAVAVLTSDALVEEIMDIVGGKVNWAFMWNLSRISSEELITQIGLHYRVARELGIGSEESRELLWRLAGGNPRALERIWKRGLKRWLEGEVLTRLSKFVEKMQKTFGERLWEELWSAASNIDDADIDFKTAMLKRNIAIYIAAADKISEIPSEPWIGREYAFQIPAYYHALKAMARKRSRRISPEDVIREAMA